MSLINQILSIFKKKSIREEPIVKNYDIPLERTINNNDYLEKMVSTLYPRQKELFDMMSICNKLQICLPTGVGKNYLMKLDLLRRLGEDKSKILVISSHRLMLNTQHMNDIFETLSKKMGEVGFVFVGSSSYDVSKFKENKMMNKSLRDLKLSYRDILSSTISKSELSETIKKHFSFGRQVVVITTYHSLGLLSDLEIDTIYCDEAHTLATTEESKFEKNFKSLSFKNSYFFTATPKDCDNETDAFLMNNIETFGKREGLSLKESVDLGFIVKPVIHIALPSEYDPSINFKSTSNMVRFIEESFTAHRKYVLEKTFDKSKISPKILVKCSSVDEMWSLHKELINKISGVKICAGASRSSIDGGENHYIGLEGISDRNEYLRRIQEFEDNEEVIVLHYDILSEGINVPGFTGVMFLSGSLPTMPKTLQNLGRSTRLHKFDRSRLKDGEINTKDLSNWIKPYCSMIIPYWDSESELTKSELCNLIRKLRDEFDFHPVYLVSLGNDLGKIGQETNLEILNKKNKRERGFQIIEDINHEIENLDLNQKIDSMTDSEWDKFILDYLSDNNTN